MRRATTGGLGWHQTLTPWGTQDSSPAPHPSLVVAANRRGGRKATQTHELSSPGQSRGCPHGITRNPLRSTGWETRPREAPLPAAAAATPQAPGCFLQRCPTPSRAARTPSRPPRPPRQPPRGGLRAGRSELAPRASGAGEGCWGRCRTAGAEGGGRGAGGSWSPPWGTRNAPGRGEGPGPRRPSAAHLRVGHHQALVAFTVVAPFILVHLPLVHSPVLPWRLSRPRAGGRPSAWAPAAAVGGGAPVSHGLASTLPPRLPGSSRRKPRPRWLPWLSRATSGFAPASPPLIIAAEGQGAIFDAGRVTHFRSADFRIGKVPARAPEVRQAGGDRRLSGAQEWLDGE